MMKYDEIYGGFWNGLLHFLTKKEDDDPNETLIFMFGMAWKNTIYIHLYSLYCSS
jgi:hypothetical protein